jgi:hypothetical protein
VNVRSTPNECFDSAVLAKHVEYTEGMQINEGFLSGWTTDSQKSVACDKPLPPSVT